MLKWIEIFMVEFVIGGVNIHTWINYVYVIIKWGIEFILLGCVRSITRKWHVMAMCARSLR